MSFGNPEAIIFDMDGVLIDAREWHYLALNESLAFFGMEIDFSDHEVRFDGLPTRDKLRILSQESGLPNSLHGLVNRVKQERTLRIAGLRCFPKTHHHILLSSLKRNGVKLGLATNSIRETTESMLALAGLINFFDVIVTNEDVVNAKPDPEIYQLAMAKLDCAPERALIVEDSPFGIAAAEASGAKVLKVSGPHEVNVGTISNFFAGGLY